jgi:hypothetical protein
VDCPESPKEDQDQPGTLDGYTRFPDPAIDPIKAKECQDPPEAFCPEFWEESQREKKRNEPRRILKNHGAMAR